MIKKDNTTPNGNVNNMSLEKAAIYYSQFARVFPLQPNSKMPMLAGSWTTYATQDPLQIIQWWTLTPNANIALVADNNFTIIDLDIKDGKDGLESFRDLYNNLSLDINTIAQPATSGSGGKHIFYTHPANRETPFHNATNKGSQGGIDIRSGNAYVVAAPSVVNNQAYHWPEDSLNPLEHIPELPQPLHLVLDEWATSNIIDISQDQPDLLPAPLLLNEHPCNQLPQHLQEFALHGNATNYQGDGSAALMGLASRLYILGLQDDEVLTFLSHYPGPSSVAFKRRPGSFESAVSWLWKYSCSKARSNRKMSQEEITNHFASAGQQTTIPDHTNTLDHDNPIATTGELPDLTLIESIDDFGIAREYMAASLTLPPLEHGVAMSKLKDHLKWMGIGAKAVDKELKLQETTARAMQASTHNSGPVFAHLSDNGAIRATTQNFMGVMNHHNIGIKHNVMSHDYDIYIPGAKWLTDTAANDQRTFIRDMLEQYGMPSARVDEYVSLVGGQNSFHPTIDMLTNTTWDGTDRLTSVLNTLELAHGTTDMRDKLVTTWLVSALKVLGNYGNNPPRGVLVLAGPQYCGKTSFFRAITPPTSFGEGLHLEVHDKDSLKKAVKYWIVELGELDATFKKSDIAALKAHISNTQDEIRLPYAAKESRWQRRTVYGATVNRIDFLQDSTGNTRFWPVEVKSVDVPTLDKLMHGDGRAQFWAQLQTMLDAGHPYLLNQKEIKALENHNDDFREIKMEEEILLNTFNWQEACTVPMTVGEVAAHCGFKVDIKGRNPLTEPLQRLTGQARTLLKRRAKGAAPARCWIMPPLRITAQLTTNE